MSETARDGLAARLGSTGRKLLIPFLTAGFPDPETTAAALEALPVHGADAIELGVPFSDPLADGPTIAAASQAALEAGMTLSRAIDLGAGYAATDRPPLVLFTYLNPVAARGLDRTAADLAAAGFGGALIADLPFDEDPAVGAALGRRSIPLIRLAAPTTGSDRLRQLAESAEGFVYLIARTGVTGTGAGTDRRLGEKIAVLRQATGLPIVVGFGITGPDDARRAAEIADGVVVGSAFVRRLDEAGVIAAVDWIGQLRDALDRG